MELHAWTRLPLRQYYSRYEESALSDFQMLVKDQLPRLIRYAAALTRDADEALDLAETPCWRLWPPRMSSRPTQICAFGC